MSNGQILRTLETHGVIEDRQGWSLEPASGGMNSRVLHLRRDEEPEFTVRIAGPDRTFDLENEAIADVSDCPGVPRMVYASDSLLVHRYLAGSPRPLQEASHAQLRQLASVLSCVHSNIHQGFTPWPERQLVVGSRADLFSFRVQSLRSYSIHSAISVDQRIAGLLATLEAPDRFNDPGWGHTEFARLHGDLSVGNILWAENSVNLIDWEYSRIGDPAEELAYLITEQPVDQSRINALKEHYGDEGGAIGAWSRVPLYAAFTALDSALWWADYGVAQQVEARNEIRQRVDTAQHWASFLGLI